jgi:hypothetical protein
MLGRFVTRRNCRVLAAWARRALTSGDPRLAWPSVGYVYRGPYGAWRRTVYKGRRVSIDVCHRCLDATPKHVARATDAERLGDVRTTVSKSM